ncbi:cbb3-type cytochrome oxidase assembly protein CcoS [Carboxylicivirga caseinilyticus]|uniref:cbb3-type cytochrome oxidase assembly protein CcoS n=1 Tax=Carboxylicivirga caseinilyticus TaxID=3417572 RepID=UPI002AA6FD5C|nr:cbb3-type cytochrome oxidase assembly protein CcoS [uncultured Carboxylicivirga sp.]MCU4164555.1 cbb3-type cytochrome oxidase assembly protein CcoS [Marinilabiliaceae bacterium A049]
MEIIIVLVIISLLVALFFLSLFIWAVKTGQYEDDYSPSVRILFDQQERKEKKSNNKSKISNEARDVLLRQ